MKVKSTLHYNYTIMAELLFNINFILISAKPFSIVEDKYHTIQTMACSVLLPPPLRCAVGAEVTTRWTEGGLYLVTWAGRL